MQIFVLWRYFVVRYCEVLLRRSFARQPRLIRRSLCSVEPRALDELSGRGLCFFFEDMLYSTMSLWRYYMSLMALTGGSALASGQTQAPAEVLVSGQTACDDCLPRVAVTTNLLHDAALTPDLGLEVSIARRWSVAAEGVWAWWSNARRHRYWRIAQEEGPHGSPYRYIRLGAYVRFRIRRSRLAVAGTDFRSRPQLRVFLAHRPSPESRRRTECGLYTRRIDQIPPCLRHLYLHLARHEELFRADGATRDSGVVAGGRAPQ